MADVKVVARYPRLRAVVTDDAGEIHDVTVVRVPERGDVGMCSCRRAGGWCVHVALVRAVASGDDEYGGPNSRRSS